jgi:DNA/RNA-binding domain of Phe-tRNA-synthetase-like protein
VGPADAANDSEATGRGPVEIEVAPHPLLHVAAFVARWPAPLGELASPAWLVEGLAEDADAPVTRDEETRATVRDLLRYGGYKPTGRGKPASEYLVRAASQGRLGSINPAVDACNVVSLHSGLPASVVDLDLTLPPLRIDLAPSGSSYVFNPAGQEMRVEGLPCLHDGDGPCANAVKDAQRTKTGPATRTTLAIIWGHVELGPRAERTVAWFREIVARLGAEIVDVRLRYELP